MFRKYNIYDQMLFAAAGDPPSGGAEDDGEGGASSSSNAKTINAGDPDPDDKTAGVDDVSAKNNDVKAGDNDPGAKEASVDDVGEKKEDGDEVKPKPKVVPQHVMLRRVGELSRDKQALAAENAELKRRLEKAPAPDGEDKTNDNPPQRSQFNTETEFQQAVRQEAARQRAQEDFDNRCNEVADLGEKTYKDGWNESVANLRMLSDDGQIPLSLLNAALAADDPAKAIHELGQNPEEALRIMSLRTPEQRVAEVIKKGLKIDVKAAQQRQLRSKAPDPIDPVGGAGGSAGDDGLSDAVDDDTWYQNRQAQLKSKRSVGR